MLTPYLHFDGNCKEAIDAYEKAFNTKVDAESIDYMPDGKNIAHAAMVIYGTKVFLNDALKFLNDTFGNILGATHLMITFDTVDELFACYEILKASNDSAPFYETSYSRLAGNFIDKFGVLWAFMVPV